MTQPWPDYRHDSRPRRDRKVNYKTKLLAHFLPAPAVDKPCPEYPGGGTPGRDRKLYKKTKLLAHFVPAPAVEQTWAE